MLPEVINPLLNINILSVLLRYVPETIKLTDFKPLIKKPQLDSRQLVNYRPISNLPVLSKILGSIFTTMSPLREKTVSVRISSEDLDHIIDLRLLSLE